MLSDKCYGPYGMPYRRVMGIRRPVPNAFSLTLSTTPICQRLCSERRRAGSLRFCCTRRSIAGRDLGIVKGVDLVRPQLGRRRPLQDKAGITPRWALIQRARATTSGLVTSAMGHSVPAMSP